jgi:hypothetical protein
MHKHKSSSSVKSNIEVTPLSTEDIDPSSLLSKSGVLYATNFNEWKEGVISILQIHGLESRLLEGGDGGNSQDGGKKCNGGSDLATVIIIALVNPEIIDRIPTSERSRPWLLIQRLQSMTTQFRFLDLPAELRNRIYSLVLTGCDRVTITSETKHTTEYPSITKISRQIRSEVLPVFYSSTTCELSFRSTSPGVARVAQNWACNVVGDWLKQLRTLSINVRATRDSSRIGSTTVVSQHQEIWFTLGPDKGLLIHYPQQLTDHTKSLLDRQVKSVRRTSEVMGIHKDGRVLLLALVHQQEKIWNSQSLRLKN